MDEIEKRDVTDRATAGGWVLPAGWTVNADISYDIDESPMDSDGYTPAQVEAWRREDWTFVVVSVRVEDPSGREWGRAVLGSVEYGTFTLTDDYDNVTGTVDVDPLEDAPGEYSALREHDLIGEALRDAVAALEAFGTPVLTEPGTFYTGL